MVLTSCSARRRCGTTRFIACTDSIGVRMDDPRRVIARLEEMPVRAVWPMEEYDLTPWLADNLDVLEKELGFGLELISREHRVGRYELDLLLRSDDGRTVVVENQFGRSDHGHLGQLLAYSAGTEAEVVVW